MQRKKAKKEGKSVGGRSTALAPQAERQPAYTPE